MTGFASNQQFMDALRQLIDQWCEQKRLLPLARLLPAYTAFSGLTDSWADLWNALKDVRALGREAFPDVEWEVLNDLIRAADQAIRRR